MDININGLIIIFAIASIVAIFAKLIRWPYTITLVLAGIFVVILGLEAPEDFELDRDLIFHILLPPLLFEGALHMRLSYLRENAKVITLLVLPGLMISVFLVAILLNLAFPVYPFIILLLFAAIIIPTDPASILAFYKEMKVPKKLRSIVEGESVFDDGLAIVLFSVILGVILVAYPTAGSMSVSSDDILSGVGLFLKLSFLGILLGVVLGYGAYLVMRKIDDKFTEVMITVILAFGIFALAEAVEASGVLAVVVAGLILGNYGTRVAMAPSTRMTLLNFWSFLAFAVTSFLFILVGMNVSLSGIWDNIWLIVAGILCLWLARALMIFVIGRVMNRNKTELPGRWQMTMWWGGLRGAIPIAMALSIPTYVVFIADNDPGNILFPYRDTIIAVTFGVVLGTLIIQGFTLRPLLRRLGFYGVSIKEAEQEEKEIAALLTDSMSELKTLEEEGDLSKQGYEWLSSRFANINSQLITEMGTLIQEHGFIPKEEYIYTVHEALEQKKKVVSDAWARNLISGATGEKLIFEIESQISALTHETLDSRPRTPVEILRSVTGTETTSIERNCGICMDLIEPGQSVIKCRCGTLYHLNCLGNIDRCPICIAVLEKPNAGG